MNGHGILVSFTRAKALVSIAAAALVCILASPALYADGFSSNGVTVSMTSTITTTTEGTPLVLDFNFQNNSGQDVTLLNVGFLGTSGNPAFVSGDSSDSISSTSYTECNGTIANGSSCTFSITINSPADTGETDQDSGVWNVTSAAEVFFANGFAFEDYFNDQVTIKDPVLATPEPSSLLMLGTGVVGLLGGSLRKRLM